MRESSWNTDERVYREEHGIRRYGIIESVRLHQTGSPWIVIRYDDGGYSAGTQNTLRESGIHREGLS